MSDSERRFDRRTVLKSLGGAAVLGTVGTAAFASPGAAQSGVQIQASNPATVANDRGDLHKVTANPSYRIEWENFDQAVGKVMMLIEARTKEDGEYRTRNPASESTDYWVPVFRATPWLTENVRQNGGPHVDYSKPGTTGYFEITSTLGEMVAYAARARTESNTPDPRPLELVNESGQPDYENTTYPNGVDVDSFLLGNSLGGADNYDFVNNFEGADAGYYGAAIDTSHFDVPTDGNSDSDTVELRYTFALLTVNDSWRTADYAGADSWFADVPSDEVTTGHSVLAMEGDGEYPSVTEHGAGSPSSKYYPAYHALADEHPAVLSDTISFAVNVQNELSATGGDGSTNAGAE